MSKTQGFTIIELTIVLVVTGLIILTVLAVQESKGEQLAHNNIIYKKEQLYVLTDSETGCEYLTTWEWGITPRLNSDGEHICKMEVSK